MKRLPPTDNICLNCGKKVEHRFCSYCGQEHTHPNLGVLHIFKQFHGRDEEFQSSIIESLKLLLFKPGFLTKEYISGKRKKYMSPVRIYILISFIFFFIIKGVIDKPNIPKYIHKGADSKMIWMPIKILFWENYIPVLDSLQGVIPSTKMPKRVIRYYDNKVAKIHNDYRPGKATEIFAERLNNALAKAFFLLFPLFGLWLWLLQNKKKYTYSNHLIFSIHFHSVLFILMGLYTVINLFIVGLALTFFAAYLLLFAVMFYLVAALRYTYEQSWWLAAIKGVILMAIHIVFIFLVFIGIYIYVFLTI